MTAELTETEAVEGLSEGTSVLWTGVTWLAGAGIWPEETEG